MTSFIGNAPNQVPTNGDLGTAAFVEAASLATLTDTQTLTNKTLTSPIIDTATISGGTINNASVGATTPAAGTFTSLSDSGNLTFTGTGNRILGDFSNATQASRVSFQSSTTNGNTTVQFIPNGTGTVTGLNAYSSSDVANSSFTQILSIAATEARFASGKLGTGTFLPMTFHTSDSERMRIDSSGNVGIGKAPSSGVQLDIRNPSGNTTLQIDSFIGTAAQLTLNSPTFNTIATPNLLTLITNGAERMRIDASGNLLVGTSGQIDGAFGSRLNVDAGSINGIIVKSTASSWNAMSIFTSATLVGSITAGTTSTAYNTSSDYRLKENIAPMTGALETVAQLNPVTYNWKVDGSNGQGFIAHELQEIVPDCVTGEKDAVDKDGKPVYQGIDTSFLVATLTAAIQEQQAIITEQSGAIANLKSRIELLENNI